MNNWEDEEEEFFVEMFDIKDVAPRKPKKMKKIKVNDYSEKKKRHRTEKLPDQMGQQ